MSVLERNLKAKDTLLQESLNCTFVACPCAQSSKQPNMQLVFKLRKKVMHLRDLVALQECEIASMRNSVKFVQI